MVACSTLCEFAFLVLVPLQEYTITDSAYVPMLHVVPLFKVGHRATRPMKRFNDTAASIQVRIEHAFHGMLKSRFMSLQGLRTMLRCPSNMNRAMFWIQACMVLHSIPRPGGLRNYLIRQP